MKHCTYILILFFSISIPVISTAQKNDLQQVKNVLTMQSDSWNEGNIDAFMQGYWNHDSLTFISKGGITYGWKQTLANYKKSYPDTASMGKLNFTLIQLKKLSEHYYFVTGKWHLSRTIGDIGGYFTLLFKKINKKWVIITDHTS
jgi:hypothetical protein